MPLINVAKNKRKSIFFSKKFYFYFLGDMGIKWVFLIELPDTGTFGFLLPANKIVPTGQSIFEGIRALAVTISHTLVY